MPNGYAAPGGVARPTPRVSLLGLTAHGGGAAPPGPPRGSSPPVPCSRSGRPATPAGGPRRVRGGPASGAPTRGGPGPAHTRRPVP
ncbi:hypothetical protein DSY14_00405 [Nocardiopsis sp. MG754419]|nr:hypothetical protein [Nocardiopsis sp. MG754419]